MSRISVKVSSTGFLISRATDRGKLAVSSIFFHLNARQNLKIRENVLRPLTDVGSIEKAIKGLGEIRLGEANNFSGLSVTFDYRFNVTWNVYPTRD